MEYINFEIHIVPGQPYQIFADQSDVGEAEGLLYLTLDSQDFQNGLLQLKERQTNSRYLVEFGRYLYDNLFTAEIGAHYNKAVGFAQGQGKEGVRIRLRISASELSSVPWELICDSSGSFLGTDLKSPLIRWLNVTKPIRKMQAALPLRMLAVIPKIDSSEFPLQVDNEVAALRSLCEQMKGEVEFLILDTAVSLKRIEKTLLDTPCQVIHFIGHGKFQQEQGALLLNNDKGGMDWVNEYRLAEMLKNHPVLKLIVLNACEGATVSSGQTFTGIAPNLIKAGIPAVIAMQYPVYDQAAILFSEHFYNALFSSKNTGRVDCAMAYARSALIRELPDEREFATPVLFLRAPEGVLFHKYSGNRVKDAAFSQEAVETEKAIDKTYEFNQSLASDDTASQDPELIEQLKADKREHEYLKKRIAFSKRIAAAAVTTSLLLFMFCWTGLFDLFRLDTMLEGLTLAVSNSFVEQNSPNNVVLVSAEDSDSINWRNRFAQLTQRLTEAGAKVVAFDIIFDPLGNPDDPGTKAFADAIQQAKEQGTKVVLGFERLQKGIPVIEERFREVLGEPGLGLTCLSTKLNFVTITPTLVKKTSSGVNKNTYSSLALAAFFAANNITDHTVDFEANKIHLLPETLNPLLFSRKRVAVRSGCPAITTGDTTTDLFIDLTPAETIRDKQHTVSFDEVLSGKRIDAQPDFFTGKVVFVGLLSEEQKHRVFDIKNGIRYGIELHADSFKTIQQSGSGRQIVRSLDSGYEALLIFSMTCIGGLVRLLTRPTQHRLRLFLLIVIPFTYAGVCFGFCISFRLLIDWLYHLAGFFFAYLFTGRVEKRWS